PDLRALLDDATARSMTHPDPVGAVHARVRQRTARRRAAVAAGTSAALATAGTVAVTAGTPDRRRPATAATATTPPAPTPGATRYDTTWRALYDAGPVRSDDESVERVQQLTRDNDDTFVGVAILLSKDGGNAYTFAFGAGVDRSEWSDEIEAAVGDRRWQTTQCPDAAPELDRMASEALSADWPSGAHVPRDQHTGWRVGYRFPCTVVVTLSSPYADGADVEYARTRWDGAVFVQGVEEAEL
ncbi:MAG TPA: hypothetical protein VNA20_10265, partial [Frankiaceae bacterium]|nr:hypothetical protein [Frankiaceae bacterium]